MTIRIYREIPVLQFFNKIVRPIERDCQYWHNGYFIRIFDEEHGKGWQVYRNNKFIYRNGKFVDLVDGGVTECLDDAYRSAEEYIENCLTD